MSDKLPVILVAEDDKSVRLVVQQALTRQGYVVHSSGNADGLWKLIESGRGDLLITDVALPDGDALDLLPRIKERRPDLPVIRTCAVLVLAPWHLHNGPIQIWCQSSKTRWSKRSEHRLR